MHTQTLLVFLEIKLPRNSNKILKRISSKRWIFEKVFENQLHQLGPIGRANLFACDFGKQWLVLIITSKIKLEISRPL